MWGLNRYDRPSWVTGFLVCVACLIAMFGGLMMFLEGKKVKSTEGIPLTEQDIEKLRKDKEQAPKPLFTVKPGGIAGYLCQYS